MWRVPSASCGRVEPTFQHPRPVADASGHGAAGRRRGDEDIDILESHHHNGDLVYNDFGADLLDDLRAVGSEASLVKFECPDPGASRTRTFVARRPDR